MSNQSKFYVVNVEVKVITFNFTDNLAADLESGQEHSATITTSLNLNQENKWGENVHYTVESVKVEGINGYRLTVYMPPDVDTVTNKGEMRAYTIYIADINTLREIVDVSLDHESVTWIR